MALLMPAGFSASQPGAPSAESLGYQLPPLSTNALTLSNSAPTPNAGSANATTTDASTAFGNALTAMLQKAQQTGTQANQQVQTGQLNNSDAGLAASNAALNNPALRGYAPSTILNAGSSAQQPFNTAEQGVGQVGQSFNTQLSNFGNALSAAKDYMTTYQAQQDKAKTDAQNIIHDAVAGGSASLDALIKTQPDLLKLAGYTPDTLQGVIVGLKKKEDIATASAKGTQVIEAGGHQLLIDSHTGETIKDLGSAYHPSSGGSSGNITIGSPSITNPAEDTAVANIIASNPGEWGKAANAIDKQFGKGTATKYDSWLTGVYQGKQNINDIYQPESINGLKAIDVSRLSATANRIVANYVKSPIYDAVSNGSIYLQRINAANQQPGSISDADLLDSLTKLNTGGNIVTETQIKTITGGQSISDWGNILSNKLNKGGILSNDQRQQIKQLANTVYTGYQSAYQPLYNQATSQLRGANIPSSLWSIPDWNTLTSPAAIQGASSSNVQNQPNLGNNYNSYLKAIGQ